jgi:hypothetical protein
MHSQQFQECHPRLIHKKVIMGKYTVTSISTSPLLKIAIRVSLFLSDCACENSKGGAAAVGHVSLHAGIKNGKQQKAQNARMQRAPK